MKHHLSHPILFSLVLALLAVQPASAVDGVWTPAGSLSTPRSGHSATLLPGGKVLVAGGYNGDRNLASAQLYDPFTGRWMNTGSMHGERALHAAVRLRDGRVMVIGGTGRLGTTHPITLWSAEIYDPATSHWTEVSEMGWERRGHTATLLADGRVLVAGGEGDDFGFGFLSTAELYDPATDTWRYTGSMNFGRRDHEAVRLMDGRVLVVGSASWRTPPEVYDPATGTWTPTGPLHTQRYRSTVTRLSNGMVLMAGGADSASELASAELYDPATNTWTETGPMAVPRTGHTASLLPDGKVLVSGGWSIGHGVMPSAELYDPATGAWTTASSLGTARFEHRAVRLQNGRVLAIAGRNENELLASAELYPPSRMLRLKSGGPRDGWVLESSENSNQGRTVNGTAATFLLGDDAQNRQYRSILHFNTAALPAHAVITGVTLEIKKRSLVGTDPFTTHGNIAVDIRKGSFRDAPALLPGDFQAAASKPGVGSFTDTPQTGGWYSASLWPAAYPFINLVGVTQLRLRFQRDDDNDAVADFIRFYGGNASAADRPVLVIEYYVP